MAASTHVTKAGTRAVANTSPEPFSNWFLSLAEDVFVLGLGALALKFPVVALVVAVVLLVLIGWFFVFLVRAARSPAAAPARRVAGHRRTLVSSPR